MASLQQFLLLSLLFQAILIIKCDDDEEDNLLRGINEYRTSLNLTSLTKNERAECLASEIADQFKNQPCTNSTGANTVPGTEPQYQNFPNILRKCHLNVTTTRDGQIMPACVPNLDPTLVLSNFTKSQYSGNLNDTQFSGIGIGSEDNWIVVVLTTNTPEGSYSVGTNTNNNRAARDADEEDNLHQGINLYRASLNLTLLTKNERAECLASEIADQFNNQPCTTSTGANTLPGTEPQYRDFPNILRKCNLNVNTTQIMPACVPNLDSNLNPNLVLASFTKSQYSGNLNDTRFSGIGIGTEDDWIVVVVTTNASDGSYSLATNSNSNGAVKVTDIGRYMVFFVIGVSAFLL